MSSFFDPLKTLYICVRRLLLTARFFDKFLFLIFLNNIKDKLFELDAILCLIQIESRFKSSINISRFNNVRESSCPFFQFIWCSIIQNRLLIYTLNLETISPCCLSILLKYSESAIISCVKMAMFLWLLLTIIGCLWFPEWN
jgi:hypothetical protein